MTIHPDKDKLIPNGIQEIITKFDTTTGFVRGRYIFNTTIHISQPGNSDWNIVRKHIVVLHPTEEYHLKKYTSCPKLLSENYDRALSLLSQPLELLGKAGLMKDNIKEPAHAMLSLVCKGTKSVSIPTSIQKELESHINQIIMGRYLKIDKNGDAYMNHPKIGKLVFTFLG